jgi:hypothetical protein
LFPFVEFDAEYMHGEGRLQIALGAPETSERGRQLLWALLLAVRYLHEQCEVAHRNLTLSSLLLLPPMDRPPAAALRLAGYAVS